MGLLMDSDIAEREKDEAVRLARINELELIFMNLTWGSENEIIGIPDLQYYLGVRIKKLKGETK